MNIPAVYDASPSLGLDVLHLANDDLADSCSWVPTEVTPGATPLPIYPTPVGLQIPLVRS